MTKSSVNPSSGSPENTNNLSSAAVVCAQEPSLPPLPDKYEAAAHMYPWDLETFKRGEHAIEAYSIPVGCSYGKSVPLWTSEQMQEYARAAISTSPAAAEIACLSPASST